MFQYNHWADRRMLDACAALTNEQFTRDLGSSFSSVRDTLAHLYGAEWIWNERFKGRSPSALFRARRRFRISRRCAQSWRKWTSSTLITFPN